MTTQQLLRAIVIYTCLLPTLSGAATAQAVSLTATPSITAPSYSVTYCSPHSYATINMAASYSSTLSGASNTAYSYNTAENLGGRSGSATSSEAWFVTTNADGVAPTQVTTLPATENDGPATITVRAAMTAVYSDPYSNPPVHLTVNKDVTKDVLIIEEG